MKKKLIIFTDIGDTVIDESTEVRKVPYGVVYEADCIPGAKETMLSLYEQGYTIVMVADGLEQSFRNTMKGNGLDHVFSEWVISEQLGVEKPNRGFFDKVFEAIHPADRSEVLIVGDSPTSDVRGGMNAGIRICWYNPEHKPLPEAYRANYVISDLHALIGILRAENGAAIGI